MKNKNVGFLICGISIVIVGIIILFNKGLKDIVSETCTHGSTCGMYSTISLQTWLSIAIAALIFIIGLFLILSKEDKKIIIKKLKEKKKQINLAELDKNEKEAVEIIQAENGAIFQAALVEKLHLGKVGITRLLDKLEAKQIIERKRRGMNNIVILK